MSQNSLAPPSRPPSSASSASSIISASNLPRVHPSSSSSSATISYSGGGGGGGGGHDHTRPLPPPRLSETLGIATISSPTIPPLTAPLAPLSTSPSFRLSESRNSPNGSTISSTAVPNATAAAATSTSYNNHNNNNSNNETSHHVQPFIGDGSPVGSNTTIVQTTRAIIGNLGEVTLTVPRPELERAVNEYVETPFRHPNTNFPAGNVPASNQKCLKNERRPHHHHHHHQHHQQLLQQQRQQIERSNGQSKSSTETGIAAAQARNQENGTRRHRSHLLLQSSLGSLRSSGGTITKQPVSFTKEPSGLPGSGSLVSSPPASTNASALAASADTGVRFNDPGLSIMCDFCGRCRCESCREPTPLPSRWLCDNSCFCSSETILDYASCLCCVKGLFYHCADSGSGTDSEAGGNCADEPCSCSGPRRTARWGCLGALSLVLPCLMCYWPLKGCVAVCEMCYARHASQGCRCDPSAQAGGGGGRHHANGSQSVVSRDSRDPEKRLLDPVTPEL